MRTNMNLLLLTALALACMAPAANAVKVVECVDKTGQSTYRAYCPPEHTQKGEKNLRTGTESHNLPADMERAQRESPVTLYTVGNCDPCDLARLQLQKRAIPFAEKDANVSSVQEELRKLTSIDSSQPLTLPTVQVGGKAIAGYNGEAMDSALTKAGYPLAAGSEASTATTAASAPAAAAPAPASGSNAETAPTPAATPAVAPETTATAPSNSGERTTGTATEY